MLIVNISLTSLAGSPIRISNALNKYTNVNSRLINIKHFSGFEEDLIWKENKEKALELISKADLINFHHWVDVYDNPFQINFYDYVKKSCKFIRTFHDSLDNASKYKNDIKTKIIKDDFPKMIVGQYQERTYAEVNNVIKIVPNLVPIKEEHYLPLKVNNDKPIIFYSYTFESSGFENRWITKGYPEVSNMLLEFDNIAIIKKITKTNFFECLKIKRNSDIVIDDIMTGSYHLTSLEALSQGKPTLSYLDNRTQYILREITGAKELPFVNVKFEEAKYVLEELCKNQRLREEIGEYSRNWMEKYYNDENLIKNYVNTYEDIANGKTIQEIPKLNYPKKMLFVDIEDLIWKKRKDNYQIINNNKLNNNWFNLLTIFNFNFLSISNNYDYIRITIVGIKVTIKINSDIINKISCWIPIKKWRDNFRKKFIK